MGGYTSRNNHRYEDKYRVPERSPLCEQQATLLGRVAIPGLELSPATVDDFLLRHSLGHLAVPVAEDRIDPSVLIEALHQAA